MLDRGKVRQLFAEAAELPGDQVAAFLVRVCGTDGALREEIESLLAAVAKRPAFLSSPTAPASGRASGVAAETPGMLIGHYRLLEQIGQGGFGTVYVAEQSEPVKRRVALKIIKLGMDTRGVVARFEAERQALAIMEHPNIARVFDAGATETGRPYFVMELVRGEPITAFCDRNGLSVAERLGLFVQVCHAVQHAHSKGVIHRDIKPGNVLVATEDGRPHAKVIDFGIAKATEQRLTERTVLTELRQFIGTPEYMSPEQAEGSLDIDTRTDVYSLGVLLYELLTGATPFDPKSLRAAAYGEIQRIIREVEPAKPSTRLSGSAALSEVALHRGIEPQRLSAVVRGDLDWIVMKSLDKDRARRYETASGLAADIARHLAGAPVEAAPPSTLYRARKFVTRNRPLVVAGGAVVGVLALGIVGTSLGLMAANKAFYAAQRSADSASREAKQARAINEFMRDVLTSVEPQNSGADVRLMDVLANASASTAQRFDGYPLLEAEVRQLLGDVFDKLSLWAKSGIEYRRAQELYGEFASPDDPRTISVELRYLRAALNSGTARQVEPELTLLLPRLERVLGADDLLTLEAKRIWSDLLIMRGRIDEADSILTALRTHPRLAKDERMQIKVLHSMFRAYRARPTIADRAQRMAFWANAVFLGRECLALTHRRSGPTAPITLQTQNHLTSMLYNHEEFQAAAEMSREVLANSAQRLDECHHIRVIAMSCLSAALARLGEADEAVDMKLRSIKCWRDSAPEDELGLLSTLIEAMYFLDRAGRAAEGEAICRELVSKLGKFGGHASTFLPELFVANFVSMAGRFEEAEAILEPLRVGADASSNSFAQACVDLAYARHLTRLRRFEEAEQYLVRCVEKRDIVLGTYEGQPDDIVFAFIELYRAWQKPDKVREYEELRESAFGIRPRQ